MGDSIPFDLQYYTEKDRNNLFGWLVLVVGLAALVTYGLAFHWIPIYVRSNRTPECHRQKWVLNLVRCWETLNQCFFITFPLVGRKVYFQPSILLLCAGYIAINGAFMFVKTADLNYQPRYYIIAKRIGKIAIGNTPLLNIMILKHDLVTSITGLSHDKIEFLHHWIGRFIWSMITIHVGLGVYYWVHLDFPVMVVIPPQIFGMIAYGSLCLLTWTSIRFIRRLSYDFFLLQHKVLSILMLLFAFFHNAGSRAGVILAVHVVVLDRVLSRILAVVHKRISPTKGMSDFKVLDKDTIQVTIPIKSKPTPEKWFERYLPKVGRWTVGQHVYLNVWQVSKLQYHPFTIASLSETGDIQLLIRKKRGFTKRLMKKLEKLKAEEGDLDMESSSVDVVKMKALIYGPYGGKHQPLITFDTVVFLSAGSGSSFTLPFALDLLHEIDSRNERGDFLHRPKSPIINIVWAIKEVANIAWYMDIVNQLLPYVSDGKLTIDIYITQQQEPTSSSKSVYSVENVNLDMAGEISKEKTLSLSSVDSSIVSSIVDLELINLHHQKCKLAPIINYHADEIICNSNKSHLKSMAVVSCGPPLFVNETREVCQFNRWKKNAPDIYCLTESYE